MKAYYLVAYGHTTRWSEKVATPAEAMKYCYGMAAPARMPFVTTTRKPCYLTNKEKDALKAQLQAKVDAMEEKQRDKPCRSA